MLDNERKRLVAAEVKQAVTKHFARLQEKHETVLVPEPFEITEISPLELSITWKTDHNGTHYYRVKVSEAL